MFDIYDEEDIKQEIYILLREAEGKYDPKKGDQFSFFYNFVKYRLKTFKRDNYINVVNKQSLDKLKIHRAKQVREDSASVDNLDAETLNESEYFDKVVDMKIPAKMRMDYLRLLEGVEIAYHNKCKLLDSIKIIVEANKQKQGDFGDD
jgi:DNA-directed RNA polymerase specialized sigma subunit